MKPIEADVRKAIDNLSYEMREKLRKLKPKTMQMQKVARGGMHVTMHTSDGQKMTTDRIDTYDVAEALDEAIKQFSAYGFHPSEHGAQAPVEESDFGGEENKPLPLVLYCSNCGVGTNPSYANHELDRLHCWSCGESGSIHAYVPRK